MNPAWIFIYFVVGFAVVTGLRLRPHSLPCDEDDMGGEAFWSLLVLLGWPLFALLAGIFGLGWGLARLSEGVAEGIRHLFRGGKQ
jgi:hypothetical protein